ncbi:NUDIX hydrolase [Lysinibacillus boronitolerans]|uniref:NUDIX hydrolase n=1 Tax=Lysinibacillus boronitolerans TaxID=309788 RepID=UPI0021634142|nr:NUDIX hydrolase [Lysinibacillus boronitolerans]MCS1390034.1 NUDIX hydrolase [Lysinibacillus boronitolerans]
MGYIMDLRQKIGTQPLIMVGASILIINENNELLLQLRKDNKCWGLIGGSMELGESLEEVALREMYEESGLMPESLMFLKMFSGQEFYYQYPHGDEVFNVIAAYECRRFTGLINYDQDEATAIKFFPLHHLPEKMSPPDQQIIKYYVNKVVNENEQ